MLPETISQIAAGRRETRRLCPRTCDILIIGGGPAGSTAAILLAERGYRVVVLEKARHPRFHIGESLLPANLPLLERLGVSGAGSRHRHGEMGRGIHLAVRTGDSQEFEFAQAGTNPWRSPIRSDAPNSTKFSSGVPPRGRRGHRGLPRARRRVPRDGRRARAVQVEHDDGRTRILGHAAISSTPPAAIRFSALELQLQAAQQKAQQRGHVRAFHRRAQRTRQTRGQYRRSFGSNTAGSGSFRSPTARPASEPWSGRTT